MAVNPNPQDPNPNPNPGVNPPTAAVGKILFNLNGVLAPTDPIDPSPLLAGKNAPMKVHVWNLEAGKTYIISLNSNAFDTFLRLEEAQGGRQVAWDDDSGGGLNARITYRPAKTGVHRIIATTFNGKTGPYSLIIQEAGAKEAPKVAIKEDPNAKVGNPPGKGSFTQPPKSAAPTTYLNVVSTPGDFIAGEKLQLQCNPGWSSTRRSPA